MTNIEVYKEALDILEDIQNNDCMWEDRIPAVAATILYQLLDSKERRSNNEAV